MKRVSGVLFPMLMAFIVTYIVASASSLYGINTTTIIASILIVITGFSLSTWIQRIFLDEPKTTN